MVIVVQSRFSSPRKLICLFYFLRGCHQDYLQSKPAEALLSMYINSRPINTVACTLSVCFSKWKHTLNCTSSVWIDCRISQYTVVLRPKWFSLLM